MGRLRGAAASRTIDAKGKYVCPGFIDLDSHADRGLASDDRRRRSAPNLVSQGITTVCVNPDGASPWPLSARPWAFELAVSDALPSGGRRERAGADDFRSSAVSGRRTRVGGSSAGRLRVAAGTATSQSNPRSGRLVTRADFAYETPKRILIYADGLEFHTALRQRIQDNRQSNQLQSEGWLAMCFLGPHIHRNANDCVAQLRNALGPKHL